jgi:PAS domain-containing protein
MQDIPWAQEFPGSITVCDAAGVILDLNDRAAETFAKDGGRELVGKNLLDCHPEPSRTKLHGLLASGQLNAYTIAKGGQKKLIYQAPWYVDGEYRGLVEFALPLPDQLPHFVRDSA